jgi:hypothetical protein
MRERYKYRKYPMNDREQWFVRTVVREGMQSHDVRGGWYARILRIRNRGLVCSFNP